jgi:signal transduction histidine kinase
VLTHRLRVRVRLTLLYGALFAVSGAVLLTVTYLLLTHRIVGGSSLLSTNTNLPGPGPGGVPPDKVSGRSVEIYERGPGPFGQLFVISALVLAVLLAVSSAAGWVMAGRVLRPLDVAFDAQRDALDAQQRFVANAGHELRGPITLERAAIEIALSDPAADAASLRATCERVLAASRQQERLVDALLVLARGERGLDRYEPLDLATIADDVLLARRSDVDSRRLAVDAVLAPARTAGDPRLVERLVVNLVDNAIKHNHEGGWVRVRTTGTEIAVSNSGPVVPGFEVDRLLRPFQRLAADRTDHSGHGLGLSIVAAIAAAHHADLAVRARDGGGLDVRIAFRARADDFTSIDGVWGHTLDTGHPRSRNNYQT